MKEYLCTMDAIKILNISRASCYRYIELGMPYIEDNGHKYFNIADCATWLHNYKTAHPSKNKLTKRKIVK